MSVQQQMVDDAQDDGYANGVRAERDRVVAWLRSFEVIRGGTLSAEEDAAHEALLTVVADAIERADHVDFALSPPDGYRPRI
jgi:hypothetical protein